MGQIILIPPSEGKSSSAGSGPAFRELFPALAKDTEPVLKYLRKLRKAEIPAFYGVSSPEKAAQAHALNLSVLERPGIPAIERYTGVVYKYIDFATLAQRRHALTHLYIVSALFGLIPAAQPIPDYKLPMNPWLAKYWRDINTRRLADAAMGRPVLSLLPAVHAKAIAYTPLHTVDFKLAGGKKSAGHFGKAIKGRLVRYLMERKADDLAVLKDFAEDGYRFDGANFIQG